MSWFRRVTSAPDGDYSPLVDAMEHFHREYEEAVSEVKPQRGTRLWEISRCLPGHMAHRYEQWQSLNAIQDWLETKEKALIRAKADDIQAHYARAMTAREAMAHAETDSAVLDLRALCIEVKLMASRFAGITKALEMLHFQVGHLTKMREAGIEDATI